MEYPIQGFLNYTIDDNMVVRNHRWGEPKVITPRKDKGTIFVSLFRVEKGGLKEHKRSVRKLLREAKDVIMLKQMDKLKV